MNKTNVKLMSTKELVDQRQDYKWKLWQHVESMPSHAQRTNYVEFLERNINEINALLDERKLVRVKIA